jgi:hypothetical protein
LLSSVLIFENIFKNAPTQNARYKLSRQVSFRLTETEYLRLTAFAERAGVHVNEMARIFTTKGDHEITIARSHSPDPAIVKRLDRIGWNLNQLVKNAHTYQNVPPAAAEVCEEILETGRKILTRHASCVRNESRQSRPLTRKWFGE